MKIAIHRLHPHVPLPAPATPHSAGFDLAASEDVLIPSGEIRLVPTGLVIEVPDGHFLGIFARSSTPLKRGLVVPNGVGVVDADYCGPADEIKVQILNITSAPVQVRLPVEGQALAFEKVLALGEELWVGFEYKGLDR